MNYRPIALCNVEYIMLMKVLARRCQNVVTEILRQHEAFGIKGRFFLSNGHIARRTLEVRNDELDQVAMLKIDLERAFDQVQHDILYKILDHVGVGDISATCVRVSNTECTTELIINGNPTKRIRVESSVKK